MTHAIITLPEARGLTGDGDPRGAIIDSDGVGGAHYAPHPTQAWAMM